ncbi:MAG TPA: pur operon repressor [Candidatus Avamphibacillus sp.]|nr:pur operon repressor [Candidatus Avamphibacillus sp.]
MKRSNRLVVLTNFLLENPRTSKNLSYFAEEFQSAKSSISEDLDIVNDVFKQQGIGYIERSSGSAGGARFIPKLDYDYGMNFIRELCEQLEDSTRILPGDYLYMSDLLGNPKIVREMGRVLASKFSDYDIDVVVTVETKGIPLAYAVASFLSVPTVIARRNPKVTEGSSVSINYVSGSSRKIQTMVLPKRSLKEGSNVCIIDDFMKAGGTITGIIDLLKEFNANVKAIGVLAEADDEEEDRIVEDYVSLIKISDVNIKKESIQAQPGTYEENS